MRIVSWFRGFVLCFCTQKLIEFVCAIHSEDSVTLCLFSLWMAQCNITTGGGGSSIVKVPGDVPPARVYFFGLLV